MNAVVENLAYTRNGKRLLTVSGGEELVLSGRVISAISLIQSKTYLLLVMVRFSFNMSIIFFIKSAGKESEALSLPI